MRFYSPYLNCTHNPNENPFSKDGGTVTYTSLTYKIIRWKIPINIEIIDYNDENINQLQTKSFITKKNHINRKFFETTELYLFPCNFMKIDWYKERLEIY